MSDITQLKEIKIQVKEYKASYYNYLYESDGTTLLYNTFTGALAKLLKNDKESIKSMLESPNDTILREKNPDIWRNLIDNGFVIKKEINELDMIKLRILKSRFSVSHGLAFTFLPTRACNCRCVYCFEEPMNTTMSNEDCKAAIQFIRAKIEEIRPKFLGLSWYGGEPLLVPEIIIYLSEAIRSICNEKDILNKGSIVTNGYLLTASLAKRLKKLRIESIQITLDGPEAVHNQRRILKNGGPTYQRIKEAILIAKDIFEKVNIRIHIDNKNKDSVYELVKEDWLQGKNVDIHLGLLRDYSVFCKDWRADKNALSPIEFAAMGKKIKQYTTQRTASLNEETIDQIVNSIPLKGSFCGAGFLGSWVIGPGALIYKCIGALDSDEECGRILNGKFFPNQNFCNWLLSNPLDNQNCRECKMLPICMGGCPTVMRRYPHVQDSGTCTFWRSYLNDKMDQIAQRFKLEMN